MKKCFLLSLLLITAVSQLYSEPEESCPEIREALFEDISSIEARVRLGIKTASDIAESGNMEYSAKAEAGLRMLDDGEILKLEDEALRQRAWRAKAILYKKLFKTESASEYAERAGMQEEGAGPCPVPAFGSDFRMPYYMDFGLDLSSPGFRFLVFAGAGMEKSVFSSSVSAGAGVKYFTDGLAAALMYRHTAVPDFSCMDYAFTESYGRAEAAFSFAGNTLSTGLTAGRLLYAYDAASYLSAAGYAFTAAAFREKIGLSLIIHDDGLNKISSVISLRSDQIPGLQHWSCSLEAAMPLSFDLLYAEIGIMPRAFLAGRLSGPENINIGKRHFVYENAITLGEKDPGSGCFKLYDAAAAVDGVIRFFAFPLAAPADQLYLGINFSAGVGFEKAFTEPELLYAAGISAGFDYNDETPFELRFGIDQSGQFFTYMTIVNKISHPF